ncbi:hypothetical protein [Halothiobacillus sp. DCM-1]|uniref:hypothetical protein n=1 Tax=Halothiobacillus sp. DCM-1 TaxID=3112558 RepID=UPI0032506167
MDAELMQLMARFKLKLLRAMSIKVDTYRFIAEREYALHILQLADQAEDEELLILAMQVSNTLGMLETPQIKSENPNSPPGKSTPAKASPEADGPRYFFGARG